MSAMVDFSVLERFANFEKDPGSKRDFHLRTMEQMLEDFDHPERGLKLIHVAGSKGKGSTSAYLAALICEQRGVPVGIYSSPHVHDYRERIRSILPGMADYRTGFFRDSIYSGVLERIIAYANSRAEKPTTFELLTLMSFLCFQEAGIQTAVIEVGLGGRLDATNVVTPALTIITPIELEHTEYLGDTLEEIAAEKAGIIKEGVPLVTGAIREPALQVISEHAREKHSPHFPARDHRDAFDEFCPFRQGGVSVELEGSFSRDNALCAFAAWKLWQKIAEPGLLSATAGQQIRADVLSRTLLPGRYQQMQVNFPNDPPNSPRDVLLDAAHTPVAMEGLFAQLPAYGPGFSPGSLTVVFSCLKDKKYREMLDIILANCAVLIISSTGNFKRSDSRALFEYARTHRNKDLILLHEEDHERIPALIQQHSFGRQGFSGGLLVTGSFYLLGAMTEVLEA